MALARSSEFVRTSLPGILLEHYLDAKQEEYEQCLAAVDPAEWEHDRYFKEETPSPGRTARFLPSLSERGTVRSGKEGRVVWTAY